MLIKSVRGYNPTFGKDCYFAENSTIIGDVIIGNQVSVWFQAVIRGDVNSIRIGNKVNIQDGVIIHGTYKKASTNIGDNVSIGHNAIIHGCKLHDNVLIGMGSIIMDDCVIHSNTIIAAGSVLKKNTIVPSGSIFAKRNCMLVSPAYSAKTEGVFVESALRRAKSSFRIRI